MIGLVLGIAAQASLAAFNPNANELFDRDAQLKAWALQLFDANHDGWLTLFEAQPAVARFREIADADRDGHVTTYEFARAKDFIAARWAVR